MKFYGIFRNQMSKQNKKISVESEHKLLEDQICPLSQKKVSEIQPIDRLTISNDTFTIIVDSNFICDFVDSQLNQGNVQSNFEK